MRKNKIFLSLIILAVLFISCSNGLETSVINQPSTNPKHLSYITITQPSKKQYKVGESFDSTGLCVKAYYTDNSSKDVTEQSTITGFDSSSKTDSQTITVSYTEDNITKTSSFNISISKSYIITFHSNNSNANQTSQTVTLDNNETLNVNNFTYDNYYFLKWNTKADGTGISYKNSAPTSELVLTDESVSIDLYAIWVNSSPIIITNSNYQTIFESLQNTVNIEYLFFFTDEITQEILNKVKSVLYNLYDTKITIDFSAVTTKVSMDFRDKNYDSLISIYMPKILDRQNYAICFSGSNCKCKNLKKVQLDNKTTHLSSNAFYNCESLESINIPSALIEIDTYALCRTAITEIVIPDTVTRIGYDAFADCQNLKKVTLGNGITYIPEAIVWDCRNLENINIPSNVQTIGNRAFYNCEKLKNISIPDSVTKIGYSCFENCTSLKSVSMGVNVNTIDYCAFKGCSSLESINISDSLSKIPDSCFSGCSKLTNITLPNRLTSIGDSAFFECSSLIEITIPSKIERINWYTFKNCSSLRTVTFKSGIKFICPLAFIGCSNLNTALFERKVNWNLEDTASPPHSASIQSSDFDNVSLIATYLKDTYSYYGWSKVEE